MEVKIVNTSKNKMPAYATAGSAGMDIRADLSALGRESNVVTLGPMGRVVISTGISLEMPADSECQIRPRSGLAAKKGLTAILGTIDSDYRGELGVILINLSNETVQIEDGERVAQLVFSKYEKINFKEVGVLSSTDRGAGGYGSTGSK